MYSHLSKEHVKHLLLVLLFNCSIKNVIRFKMFKWTVLSLFCYIQLGKKCENKIKLFMPNEFSIQMDWFTYLIMHFLYVLTQVRSWEFHIWGNKLSWYGEITHGYGAWINQNVWIDMLKGSKRDFHWEVTSRTNKGHEET